MFEKIIKISILFDYYGKLLNEKQALVIDYYYNQDFSLGEISEILKISRQGVYDILKRAENKLFEYENKLRLVEKFNDYSNYAEKIIKITCDINDDKYKNIVNDIVNEANKILKE